MRHSCLLFLLVCAIATAFAQNDKSEGPANERGQKTYKEALDLVHKRMYGFAIETFKKADKQDGGACLACKKQIVKYGMEFGDWKSAGAAAEEMISEARSPREVALAHYQFGFILSRAGMDKHKDEVFAQAHQQMTEALAVASSFPTAVFVDGQALARMKQDNAAKTQFERFLKMADSDDPRRERAQRYLDDPELARAQMAPAFATTTIDGQRISVDEMQGKVMLLDFWATWYGPCREALRTCARSRASFKANLSSS